MNLDAATIAAIVTLSGIAGGFAKAFGDWVISLIKLRQDRIVKEAEIREKERQEKSGEGEKEEKTRDKSYQELWELLQHVKADAERDRVNHEREKSEQSARIDAIDEQLKQCHEDHRVSELERGKALARIDILEDQVKNLGGKLRPWNPNITGQFKPLSPDQSSEQKK